MYRQLSLLDEPKAQPLAKRGQKQEKPKPPIRSSPQYVRYPGVIAELKDREHAAATIMVQRLGAVKMGDRTVHNPAVAIIYFATKQACADFILSAMPEWESVVLFVQSDRPSRFISAHSTETDVIGTTSADLQAWARTEIGGRP